MKNREWADELARVRWEEIEREALEEREREEEVEQEAREEEAAQEEKRGRLGSGWRGRRYQ